MKKGIVDRFENEFVVIEFEGSHTKDIPRVMVSPEVAHGDVVELHDGIWQPNRVETEKRRQKIKELEDELFED
ncbi:DUF3006 domain-containing protein [Paenibacillus oralis]|uniref:DUF3006 domain-containing protein n=1 Tax=Paenibacillus oralis TaxID=2490856 RepID=UPI001FE2E602|nr:DUF3006 domain-containing protein [Paenibacillus oralis]